MGLPTACLLAHAVGPHHHNREGSIVMANDKHTSPDPEEAPSTVTCIADKPGVMRAAIGRGSVRIVRDFGMRPIGLQSLSGLCGYPKSCKKRKWLRHNGFRCADITIKMELRK